jgi:hypothetical protein
MKKLNFKLTGGYGVVVLNLAALAVLVALVWLLLSELRQEREGQLALAQLSAQNERAVENRQLFASYGEGEAKVRNYFVTAQSLPDFIEKLEALSRQAGVDFALSQAEAAERPRFEFTASGEFAAVSRFLLLLENMPHEIVWEGALLSREPDKEKAKGGWQLSAAFQLLSYDADEKN